MVKHPELKLYDWGFAQLVHGEHKTLRAIGRISLPGDIDRLIVTGPINGITHDRRRIVARNLVFELTVAIPAVGQWRQDLATWQFWRSDRCLPDRIDWLRLDGSRYASSDRRRIIDAVRAEDADRERLSLAIVDARDGDGLDVS
jgi:hypothetical protein